MRRWTGCAADGARGQFRRDEGTLDLLAIRDASGHHGSGQCPRHRADVEAALRLIPPEQRAALVLVDMLVIRRDAAAYWKFRPDREEPLRPRPRATAAHVEHLRGSTRRQKLARSGFSRNVGNRQRLTWAGGDG